jgi:hypothetical protein
LQIRRCLAQEKNTTWHIVIQVATGRNCNS